MNLPYLVVSDGCGRVFEIPDYLMAGMAWNRPALPEEEDLIPLPEGSDLFELPGRGAIGYDPSRSEFVQVREYRGNTVYPVAAFMAPAYLQFYRSAFSRSPAACGPAVRQPRTPHSGKAEAAAAKLPLYSYTAVGWRDGGFYVTATRIDPDERQDLKNMDPDAIRRNAGKMLKRYPENRLVRHLVDNCVFRYACPAARNFVMRRWECPLPASPLCNARCVGCISEQPPGSAVPASQDRIAFVPFPEEIAQIGIDHLNIAPRAVVSFGQGCEGEPLLVGDVIQESLRAIRSRTKRGVINLNTNASRPDVVERLCRAGLDSIRVSLNSAQEHYYNIYHDPHGYSFEDVMQSLRIAKRYGLWVSLNYFVFPGFTDHPQEMGALERFIGEVKVDMIQARNLNIDPDLYVEQMALENLSAESVGVRHWISGMRERFPWIKLGYFNPPREEMGEARGG
jgi:pyruvate-formate lyase-activating enzyme